MLIRLLTTKRYEAEQAPFRQLLYVIERRLGHALLRRAPPAMAGPNLLNLGCGPYRFNGWVNADDYSIRRRLRDPSFRPDWALDMTRPWRCPDNHWDGLFSEHVIEYCTYAQSVLTLSECLRTLKPGAGIRISLPDLKRYVGFYRDGYDPAQFPEFPHPALAISNLTQMHAHKSTWDADLLMTVMHEVGFIEVGERGFGEGAHPCLVRETADKAHKSFYVEARKPASNPTM